MPGLPDRIAAFAQLRFSWVDVKFGLRLLRKHPMLNLAAVFALAVGIPVGLAPSHLARALEKPLPGDADDRVRAIRYWDPLSSGVAATWDDDFHFWTQTLRSFSSLGAFRAASYNVAAADGRAAPAAGAQLSASVFPMLGIRPLVGRVLDAGDFAAGAPDVVVIGHDLWSSRFGRDPRVVGSRIRIGRGLYAVVGVMPDGFAFPTNEAFWLPLRLASAAAGAGESVRVQVIGRLADGVSVRQAQVELSSQRPPPLVSASSASETQERARLQAEVVPFGLLYLGLLPGSDRAGGRDRPSGCRAVRVRAHRYARSRRLRGAVGGRRARPRDGDRAGGGNRLLSRADAADPLDPGE